MSSRLFRGEPPVDGQPYTHLGVYILKWRPEFGPPDLGFTPFEEPEHPQRRQFGECVKIKSGGRHYDANDAHLYAVIIDDGSPVSGGGYRHHALFIRATLHDLVTQNLDLLAGYISEHTLYEDEYSPLGFMFLPDATSRLIQLEREQ